MLDFHDSKVERLCDIFVEVNQRKKLPKGTWASIVVLCFFAWATLAMSYWTNDDALFELLEEEQMEWEQIQEDETWSDEDFQIPTERLSLDDLSDSEIKTFEKNHRVIRRLENDEYSTEQLSILLVKIPHAKLRLQLESTCAIMGENLALLTVKNPEEQRLFIDKYREAIMETGYACIKYKEDQIILSNSFDELITPTILCLEDSFSDSDTWELQTLLKEVNIVSRIYLTHITDEQITFRLKEYSSRTNSDLFELLEPFDLGEKEGSQEWFVEKLETDFNISIHLH